jgi:rfaE bifunctional protein nucleotidyltransferase chain/domain
LLIWRQSTAGGLKDKAALARESGFAKGEGHSHDRSVELAEKIIPFRDIARWREGLRAAGRSLVVTNGCFDILHAGHVTYLNAARNEGDALLIGLNADASVSRIKGPSRPINCESDRATVLSGLASVDAVTVFAEDDAMALLEVARPDVYVKGGDYTIDTINQPERRLVESQGGRIVILPVVEGRSTTAILERAARR